MNFTRLTEYLDSLGSVGVPSRDLAVYRDHELVYRHFSGMKDPASGEPMRGDETYCIFSCTKLFTTCAAMQLVERGVVNLDDPVSDYLPAYAHLTVKDGEGARPAKRVMTIRHLMSMQSGLDYDLEKPAVREVMERTGGGATTRQLAEAMAAEPLCFEPGTDFLYSLSHDVLAAVIEVASGLRFSDYLKANIFGPLELATVGFSLKPGDRPRQCAMFQHNEASGKTVRCASDTEINYRLTPNYESGGAGLYCDVEDYARFADALACGGVGANGAKVLSPEMIQLWRSNQLGPKARRSFDAWNRLGYSYGLGVRTRVDNHKGGLGQTGEFGWDGAAGAWTMVDPENHLSAYFAMHVRGFGYSYDVIHPTIRSLIYEGLSKN